MDKQTYCTCKEVHSCHTDFDDSYEWDVCDECGKQIDGSERGLDHSDGEDHVFYDGD